MEPKTIGWGVFFLVILYLYIVWYEASPRSSASTKGLDEEENDEPLRYVGLRPGSPFLNDTHANATTNLTQICLGWCPPKLTTLDRIVTNLDCTSNTLNDRLRVALQLENCAPALQSPENALLVETKLRKLAENDAFVFFRGAAGFFNVDNMCSSRNTQEGEGFSAIPRVTSNGDAHPENFGTQVMVNGGLVWGVNDFDQSFNAPFTWDLRRGATGAYVACVTRGWNDNVCRQSANAFIQAYISIASSYDPEFVVYNNDRYIEGSDASNNAPLLKKVFERAREAESDAEVLRWLEEKLSVDIEKDRFYETEESIPLPQERNKDFQAAIDAYLFHGVPALMLYPPGEFWEVKSVARRLGKGTGSVGLNRFYVLLRGKKSSYGGRIVLQMKQEAHSLLEMFFRYHYTESEQGKRAVDAERGAYPYANPFFGWTNFEGHAYVIQEMSKHAKAIKIEFLTASQYIDYSELCGRALAFYHFKMACSLPSCKVDEKADVDMETWQTVSDYIRSAGVSSFRNSIASFVYQESEYQVKGWEHLRSMVRQKDLAGKSPLELLNFQLPGEKDRLCS